MAVMTNADDKTARQPEYRVYWLPLPPHPVAIDQAVLLVEMALADWETPRRGENARLVAVELVENAMEVSDAVDITLSRQDGAVLIEVWDSTETSPACQRRAADRTEGRRLPVVKSRADGWGWRLHEEGGRTVWAIVGDRDASADAVTSGRAIT
ncbi:ATP-binding protein [Actinoallomurus spadix]|uniref:Histidine kinase/HSP90-like ATPase domain-containing protein n=1 Tax=Actinoallomurus spadix TaxID=79912 RepID=A0ABN0VT56_9ACTN|nr:ATP-binding protein [Actinoallomurus spadix]MCO5987461.1 ATP-binding protein [Actinoallomurus spadix]